MIEFEIGISLHQETLLSRKIGADGFSTDAIEKMDSLLFS